MVKIPSSQHCSIDRILWNGMEYYVKCLAKFLALISPVSKLKLSPPIVEIMGFCVNM